MRKRLLLSLVVSILLSFCACGNQNGVQEKTSMETVTQQTQVTETQPEESDWSRFRAYLQENGDAVVEKDMSTDADYLFSKIVIKGKEDRIAIRFETITRSSAGGAIGVGKANAQVDLYEDTRQAQMQIQWEASGIEGSKQMIMSYDASYLWDISQYEEGDKVSFTTEYSYVDESGKSLKQEGSQLEAEITGILAPITDALRKTLSESGLGITMADLGFINY